MTVRRLLLVAGWLLIALGLGRAVLVVARDEAVNQAGIVPGAALGFGLISIGAYALMAAGFLRERRYWWLALPASLTVLAAWSMAMLISEEVAFASLATGGRGLVGLVVFAGYFAVSLTVGMLLIILPTLYVLGWIADQIPPLRRRGVGDAFRRGGRPNSGKPESRESESQR